MVGEATASADPGRQTGPSRGWNMPSTRLVLPFPSPMPRA